MHIAYTKAPGKGDTDLLLHEAAAQLQARGYRLAGTVQINTDRERNGPCDMDVKVLPDGPVIRISQNLGRGARGCRLNPSALETAVAQVETSLAQGVDCLIVNKFGKHESEGRGFRPVIVDALSRGIPVLVGLNQLNENDFLTFAEGLAKELEPQSPALLDWLAMAVTDSSEAA